MVAHVETPAPVGLAERTIGDYVDPMRPGSVTDVVNLVTRRTGIDAEGWRWDRLVSMVGGLEREARERQE